MEGPSLQLLSISWSVKTPGPPRLLSWLLYLGRNTSSFFIHTPVLPRWGSTATVPGPAENKAESSQPVCKALSLCAQE